MQQQTDSELMQQVAEGDNTQLALLFERHHLSLFRYLLHLSGDQAVSEDLVQEAFLRALKHARSYDPKLTFSVWLFGIARNAYFDVFRKRRSERPATDLEEVGSNEPMLDEVLTRKQDVELLSEAMDRLPENKREVLVLSRFHHMKYEDIARLLQCEVGTVKVRVYRALRELRAHFCELRGEQLHDA